jgi:SAM-dependent methyltransferase
MAIERHFYRRQPAIDAALLDRFADFIAAGKLIVDVGAGYDPWPHATEFVDNGTWKELSGRKLHVIDVEREPLPFADKCVDFIYCRHTIEDLSCPLLLLLEMNRVAKAGYVETPSPMAEFTRGVNIGAGLRGYLHHRWLAWVDGNCIMLLPKFPLVESAAISESEEAQLVGLLNAGAPLWNSYLVWSGSFEFRVLRHPTDFALPIDYGDIIARAIVAGQHNAAAFVRDFGLEHATFYGTAAQPQRDQH